MADESSWSRITDTLSRRVDETVLPKPPRDVVLPEEDDAEAPEGLTLGDAEGQTFMIEYLDSAGRRSLRRITVWGIVEGRGGWPCLSARCHERNAPRQFRVDRIQTCIDLDGEVFEDVLAFLDDAFGMVFADPEKANDRAVAQQEWCEIARDIKPGAVLMAAMVQSDGVSRNSEIEVATQGLALAAEKLGHFMTPDHVRRLEDLLRRTRPTPSAIRRSLEAMEGFDQRRIMEILRTAVAVMEADGRRHPKEIDLLNLLSLEMIGTTII